MYEYKASLREVVDGDTLDVLIDVGFKMSTEQRIRLKGINTPEIWRRKKDSEEYQKGMLAKEYVIRRLGENQNEFIIRTDKDPGVYGRYIGQILLADSSKSLNEELLEAGHAVPYTR